MVTYLDAPRPRPIGAPGRVRTDLRSGGRRLTGRSGSSNAASRTKRWLAGGHALGSRADNPADGLADALRQFGSADVVCGARAKERDAPTRDIGQKRAAVTKLTAERRKYTAGLDAVARHGTSEVASARAAAVAAVHAVRDEALGSAKSDAQLGQASISEWRFARVRIHPQDPQLVYVAALGHAYGPNAERGIFRSRDGGGTWERVLYRDARTGAADLTMDPNNPRILYATLRVGIYGISAGGYAAARALLPYPEFYRVGVSVAGNHDPRRGKASWIERYFGLRTPENEALFTSQRNANLASALRGKLLLVHGDVDDNVHPAQTYELLHAFIEANKDPTVGMTCGTTRILYASCGTTS